MKKDAPPLRTESAEQRALFEWAAWSAARFPGLNLMFHIPNGGARSKSEAARFKLEGVKAGVPDVCLPVARGRWHGLYIEMKRAGGRVEPEQKEYIDQLQKQGYCAVVCFGFDAARAAIENYYKGVNTMFPLALLAVLIITIGVILAIIAIASVVAESIGLFWGLVLSPLWLLPLTLAGVLIINKAGGAIIERITIYTPKRRNRKNENH